MNICIAGGSGFIGRNISNVLAGNGNSVDIIGRSDLASGRAAGKISECNVLINMMGESLIGLWTKRKRRRVYDSRILTTRMIVDLVNRHGKGMETFIQISGISVYDHTGTHKDDSLNFGNDFISRVTMDWENELLGIQNKCIRILILRLGIVLGKDGGMLRKILIPFRWGLGYTINSHECIPFIHIKDVGEIILFVLKRRNLSGVINVVSPHETSIYDFYLAMGRVCDRKIRIRLSAAFLEFVMGEMSVLLTRGQRVVPETLVNAGYSFFFEEVEKALSNILRR